MKRINPFSKQFQVIKRKKQEEIEIKWQHYFNKNLKIEKFGKCWWDYDIKHQHIKGYTYPDFIWGRYNNQLGLEIYDYESDMEYLNNLPEDYDTQNIIIEEFNDEIEVLANYNRYYFHYYLCRFIEE